MSPAGREPGTVLAPQRTMMRAALLLSSSLVAVAVVLAACSDDEPMRPPPAEPGTVPPAPSTDGNLGDAGCGFPATPTEFALPTVPGLPFGSFKAVAGTATCANDVPFTYELRDMNGDQQPDLLAVSACDDTTIGTLAWRVYPNIGTGFAAEPIRFTLPLPRLPECAKTELFDVDGDLAPDLVTTSLCTDASVGTTRWFVNRNNGAGFDPLTSFALPSGIAPGSFTTLAAEAATCPAGRPGFKAFDIDGDRKIDLVVTSVCNDTTIGTTEWRVYRGTKDGFESTPSSFALPTSPPPTLLMYASPTSATASCSASPFSRSYQLLDIDGDFAPEMVITTLCNDLNVGTTRWLVHKNLGTGFAPSPTTIDLPLVQGVRGLYETLAADPDCDARRPGFELLDMTGDFRRDLLVTRSCVDLATGVTRWHLYPSGGDRSSIALARDPVAFSLPAALGGTASAPIGLDAERSCAGIARPAFTSTYLVNRKLDLVVTDSCFDSSVGATRWLVYEAGCR